MTTYLLHGGKASQADPRNENFFEQFTKLVDKSEVTILLCYFAKEKEKWPVFIERDSNTIQKNSQKKVHISVAENPQDLLQKLERADVLYVAGGDAAPLEAAYKELVPLKQKLENKIYAGSSMGTFLASEQYILSFDSEDYKNIHQGIGLLPLQTLCHWDKEQHREMKLQMLQKSSNNPILALNEFEFTILYK